MILLVFISFWVQKEANKEEIKKPNGRVLAWRKEHQQEGEQKELLCDMSRGWGGEGRGGEKRERQAAASNERGWGREGFEKLLQPVQHIK
jgi:hypothetical protein